MSHWRRNKLSRCTWIDPPIVFVRLGIRRVLFVGDVFQPVDHLAVELFLNGDVGHGGGWRGAVPVFFARRKPDHVAGADFLDRAAPALHAPAAGGHDQGLAQRVSMPGGAGAGFERDAGAGHAGGRVRWKSGSMRTVPVNQSAGLCRTVVNRCV